jgi:hypothetical protein
VLTSDPTLSTSDPGFAPDDDADEAPRRRLPLGALLGLVVLGVVAVVGALVVTRPTPGGSAAGFHSSPRAKPFSGEQASATGATPVGRSDSRSGLAGLPTADRSALPTTTTAPTASSTTGTGAAAGTATTDAGAGAVTPTANQAEPAPTSVGGAGVDFAPAAAITLVLSATAGTTTARAEWTVTGGGASIAGFELVWSCCGARQGSIQLPAGATSHDIGNLAPATSYVLQLSAIRLDGSVDAGSVTTAPFSTEAAAAPAPATTAAPRPKPSPVPVTKTPVTEAPATTVPDSVPPPTLKPRHGDHPLPGLLPRLIDRILLGGAQSDDEGSNSTDGS